MSLTDADELFLKEVLEICGDMETEIENAIRAVIAVKNPERARRAHLWVVIPKAATRKIRLARAKVQRDREKEKIAV